MNRNSKSMQMTTHDSLTAHPPGRHAGWAGSVLHLILRVTHGDDFPDFAVKDVAEFVDILL